MAQRASTKPKRAGTARSAAAGQAKLSPRETDPAALAARVAALEAERDALAAQLETAKARIAKLEDARTQVVNRIDWVIDSLHNLVEDEG